MDTLSPAKEPVLGGCRREGTEKCPSQNEEQESCHPQHRKSNSSCAVIHRNPFFEYLHGAFTWAQKREEVGQDLNCSITDVQLSPAT